MLCFACDGSFHSAVTGKNMQKMLSVNCAECRFTNAGFQAQASLLLVRVEYLGGKVLSETGVKNKGKIS